MLDGKNASQEKEIEEQEIEKTEKVEKPTIDETTKIVEDIDNRLANESEKEVSEEEKEAEEEKEDYNTFELPALVDELEKTIKGNPIHHIKNKVEAIKSAFTKKFGTLLAEKKKAFLDEGGNSIDFQFSSPEKTKYNALVSDYRKQRDAYYNNLEQQLQENLDKRTRVIEDLKQLIAEGNPSSMYQSFRDLQNIWKSLGPIPKSKYNDIWRTYHHHVERFYDLLHLSNDYRDLDFKHNLDEKLKLIEKAEALNEEKDVNLAFKELQKLHKMWKEDIGPVAKDLREEVWQKFSEATKNIHDKRHEYLKELKSHVSEITEKKLAVIEEINNYDFTKNKSHNDWQNSIKDVEALRKKYFDAGKLPYNKSEAVWQQFKSATKRFNQEKNAFYKSEKLNKQDNLKKKQDLISLAESLKDSEDWENATNTFKKIQSDWKKIGHVPRKFSDDIWKQFKDACNHYFDRFHAQKNSLNDDQQAILDAKSDFFANIKEDLYTNKEQIIELMNSWSKLGVLPKNSRQIDTQFNKLIDKLLNGLSVDKAEIVMLKFRNIVDGYLANNDVRKLDNEQLFVRKKVDEGIREIQQLENNLSFFSNTSEDNPLIKNVKKSIKDQKEQLDIWTEKLKYLRGLNY